MKRYTCLALVLFLSLFACIALADGTPTSQFGFHGWPYRQTPACQRTCSFGCNQCTADRDCLSCGYCQSVTATARPTATPARTAVPTPAATARPQTPAPTKAPTPRPTATASPRPTSTADYTTDSSTAQEQKALNLLNQDRAANGLPALTLDSELSRIARIKSCDMRDTHYFSHTSPTYGNTAAMLTSFGYSFNGVGENIAHHATVDKAQAAFMSSTGHRTNILGSQWTKVGIGVCQDSNGFVYVTQLFVR